LRRLVENPLKANVSLTEHLSCCSPCYSRYATLLEEQKLRLRRGRFARTLDRLRASPTRTAVAVATMVVMSAGIALFVSHGSGQPIYSAFKVDLSGASEPRGVDQEPPRLPLRIPRRALDLKIQLPIGSREGPYLVSLRSADQLAWLQEAQATLIERVPTIQLHVDFRRLAPGRYQIGLQSSMGHLEYPVEITRR
jgi:hypothetical protein